MVKKMVFLAALSAARQHPKRKAFDQGLIARGKKPLVAPTAVMRRPIVAANTKLKALEKTAPAPGSEPRTVS